MPKMYERRWMVSGASATAPLSFQRLKVERERSPRRAIWVPGPTPHALAMLKNVRSAAAPAAGLATSIGRLAGRGFCMGGHRDSMFHMIHHCKKCSIWLSASVRYALQVAKRGEEPGTHPHHQRVVAALRLGKLLVGEVPLREVLAHPPQPVDEARRLVRADLPVDEHHQLALAVEAAAVIVGHHMLPEVLHHRPMGAPAEALRDLQRIAVQRAQLDDAEAIELGEMGDALGIAERPVRHDVLVGPQAQAADGHEKEPAIGDYGLLLLERELAAEGPGVGHLARQVGEIHLQNAQHVVDARERHVALGEDALYARFPPYPL